MTDFLKKFVKICQICQIFILLTSQSEFSKMFKKMPKILDNIYIYIYNGCRTSSDNSNMKENCMKTVGKFFAKKLASLMVLLLVLGLGIIWFRNSIFAWFQGTHKVQYEFVIKKFEAESKLVVAGAEVATTANQTFENNKLEEWPDWTEPITKLFVGREMSVDIPVQTEFKLVLEGIEQSDVHIQNNTLTFKQPVLVEVDSQQHGQIKISNNSNGLLDKAVDAFTSGQKAQEFLNEKSQEAIYKTSEEVLNDAERQEKVAAFAETALENLLNLNSEEKLEVEIEVSDLNFQIVDKK